MRRQWTRARTSLPVQLGVLLALAVTSAAVPATRFWLLLATNWLAVVLVVDGVRRHRPGLRTSWRVAAVFLALVAAGNSALLVVGQDSRVVLVLTAAAQLAAAGAVPGLFRGAAPPRRTRQQALGRWADLAVLAVVTSLAAVQLVEAGLAHRRAAHLPWSLVLAPAVDVTLLGVLVWTVLSRTRLVPAMVLLVAAGMTCLAFDLVITSSGHRVARPGQALEVLGVVNMSLFGVAAQHPSMRLLGSGTAPTRPRRAWVQLLLLAPFALAPAAAVVAGALGASTRIPLPALAGATVLVIVAVVVRATAALHESEDGAERDVLTGLLNRRGLERAFARAAAAPTAPGAARWLLVVDLDDFKQVNDRYGHSTGDALLLAAADRLRAVVGDGLVARHGGDEFILLLEAPAPRGDEEDDPGRRVVDALAAPVRLHGVLLPVSASAGAVPVPAAGGDDLDRLLGDADIAMYAAKRTAKGASATFHPHLREELLEHLATVEDLRALLRDDTPGDAGDVHVYYQPIVDLADGRLVGAEALVRWQHPVRGLVRPDEFLALVEHEGLGVRLDQVVLDTALEQLRRWDDLLPRSPGEAPLFLSVNLGLASMCDPLLTAWIAATAAAHATAPGRIHLEITEHEALPGEERITWAMHELVAAGFALSLDDFGIGYTSLAYLDRFPITTLKLDRSLVAPAGAGDRSLVTAIAAMARSLGLAVLAEGIETPEQADALRGIGIELAQGYHFGRPLPVQEFTAALLAQRPDRPPAGQSSILPTGSRFSAWNRSSVRPAAQ